MFPRRRVSAEPAPEKTTLAWWERFGLGKEQEYCIEHLSLLLSSGMDILSALRSIHAEMRTKQMQRVLRGVEADIEGGSAVWKALLKTKLFPDHIISIIRVGEESGQLSKNLKIVVTQQQKSRFFRSKLRSAMSYPLIVMSLAVCIGLAIAWFILPRLATVFAQLKTELPLITSWLIAAGKFLGEYGLIAIPLFLGTITASMYFLFWYRRTKYLGQNILFALPALKTLILEIELARFGHITGTLLQAGLGIVEAIESAAQATTMQQYKHLYSTLKKEIAAGSTFQQSFHSFPKIQKYIPSPIQQMIVSAEKSGSLAQAFLYIAENFEQKTENSTKNIAILLEPLLLFFIWGGVVSVALAVILPVYSLIGGFNAGISSSPPPPPAVEAPLKAAAPETRSAARIITEDLLLNQVYSEPDNNSAVVGNAVFGNTYFYESRKNEWYLIQLTADIQGWIAPEAVEVTLQPETTIVPENEAVAALKTAALVWLELERKNPTDIANPLVDALNVRSGPGTNFRIVGKVTTTDSLPVTGRENGWYQVELSPQVSGWISADYVTLIPADDQ